MAPDALHPTPPEPRRFSIRPPRPLWIFVGTIALAVAGIAGRFGVPIYREHVAMRQMRRLGVSFRTDHGGPEWLRDRLGDACMEGFDHVDLVTFNKIESNATLDAALVQLESFPQLYWLAFRGPVVTDAALFHLQNLPLVTTLDLSDTAVNGEGFVYLGRLPLRDLRLIQTPVDDAGLFHIGAMRELEHLDLSDTRVTDSGLAALKTCTKLSSLCLDGTHVTDAGLKELGALKHLGGLSLRRTAVTDQGLEYVKSIPSLWCLNLDGSKVTSSGVAALRRERPRWAIYER